MFLQNHDLTAADIELAAQRLAPYIITTPILESAKLNHRCGGRILLKAECLQRTGSFKIRGALNAIGALSEAERRAGVVAFSSGNHAQGVAAAAAILGTHATVFMPQDSPRIKVANARFLGAQVRLYDRLREDREALAKQWQAEHGAALIPPFDDERIMAGQGTVGLEILRQTQGEVVDQVLVPCGGGGLIAGAATALGAGEPGAPKVYAAEPEALNDTALSLAAGHRVTNAADAQSICDALRSPSPGVKTFAVQRRRLAGGWVASDAAVRQAMAVAFEDLKIVLEPGGAIALAVALSQPERVRDRVTVVIGSGGNVDASEFVAALQGAAL